MLWLFSDSFNTNLEFFKCSEHSEDDDFKFTDSRASRLKDGACFSLSLRSARGYLKGKSVLFSAR